MTASRPGPVSRTVNLWSEAEHALDYFERRSRIPHRSEGYVVLGEFLPDSARRVLDLGTGDGDVAALVLDHVPGIEVMAVDFSAEMLARARERFGGDDRIRVVEHDLDEPLPEEWGPFDAVVSAFVIHHLGDDRKRALVAEVFARLEPGGVFLNLEHVDSPTPELHVAFLDAIGSSPERDDPSNKLVSVEAQLRWMREVGFVQVDCHWKWRELALLGGVRPPGI